MTDNGADHDGEEGNRRDFLYVATGAFGAVGAVGVTWPLIDQMNPDKSVLALSSIEIDISSITEGQGIVVKWRGQPVFIRRRTNNEIEEARATELDDLIDGDSRSDIPGAAAEATDEARVIKAEWLVLKGSCTHLGCVPLGTKEGQERGEYGGWFCPCHGSHYDISGRIRKGPAPENLGVPPYQFLSDNKVKIG